MFAKLGLRSELVKAVDDLAYKEPTPVQVKVIKQLLDSSKDLIVVSDTGSGKTAAYSLPIISQIDLKISKTQAVILAPTRELAIQIKEEITSYLKYFPQVKVAVFYGGVKIQNQIDLAKEDLHIVVGTPGRLLDLIERKKLKIYKARFLVIDESDKMLGMGFREDLQDIFAKVYKMRQTMLFSATITSEVKDMVKRYLNNPVKFNFSQNIKQIPNINHTFYKVDLREKHLVLKYLLLMNNEACGIIFCRTKQKAKELAVKLKPFCASLAALQGDMSQRERNRVMEKFKKGEVSFLVATDVASRGLDIDNLNLVINYDLPDSLEGYLHRAGRTGRMGKSGESTSIIVAKELSFLQKISTIFKIDFKEVQVGNKLGNSFNENSSSVEKKDVCQEKRGVKIFINLGKKNGFTSKVLVDFLFKTFQVEINEEVVEVLNKFSFLRLQSKMAKKLLDLVKVKDYFYQDVLLVIEESKSGFSKKKKVKKLKNKDLK